MLEFAVAASLLGLLVAALVTRMLFYQAEAERVAVEQLVGTLRGALQVQSARVLAGEGVPGLERLAEDNPMNWLARKPKNYLGEYYAPQLNQLPKGNWFFDRRDKTVVYLPSASNTFSSETSKFLKLKVKLLRLPSSTQIKGQSKINYGIVLDQVDARVAVNN
jgi:type II secretory pathway pseudopilin PulG